MLDQNSHDPELSLRLREIAAAQLRDTDSRIDAEFNHVHSFSLALLSGYGIVFANYFNQQWGLAALSLVAFLGLARTFLARSSLKRQSNWHDYWVKKIKSAEQVLPKEIYRMFETENDIAGFPSKARAGGARTTRELILIFEMVAWLIAMLAPLIFLLGLDLMKNFV